MDVETTILTTIARVQHYEGRAPGATRLKRTLLRSFLHEDWCGIAGMNLEKSINQYHYDAFLNRSTTRSVPIRSSSSPSDLIFCERR
jgi:hypothetical protein